MISEILGIISQSLGFFRTHFFSKLGTRPSKDDRFYASKIHELTGPSGLVSPENHPNLRPFVC